MSGETVPNDLTNLPQKDVLTLTRLPVKNELRIAYLTSLFIVLLTGAASVAGLLSQSDIYPTEELQQTFVANDVVNLVIGLPILMASMWLTWRGRLIGLLFWPGALFYGLYNYVMYLYAVPLNWIFLIYLAIVTLSFYTTIGLVASIDGTEVKSKIYGRVPEKFAGGLLFVFGLLFMARALIVMADAVASQNPIARPELALLVVDFLFSPVWVIGGVMLWRRQALGYIGGTGLLFQASMLFIGLIAVLLLQPILTGASFALTDVIVVFLMGFICFIPFALFIRGVVK